MNTAFFSRLLCCALTVFCLAACGAKRPNPDRNAARRESVASPEKNTEVPRADPGYVQWLEKQSMIAEAGELARIISGSELPWRVAGGDRSDILLSAADTWLRIHPASLLTGGKTAFRELGDDSVLDTLQKGGIRGLFIAPALESGAVWRNKNKTSAGDDAVSLRFAEYPDDDKDFERLRERAEKRGMQVGSDILSPAVGIGPDFLLAVRAVREYPGAFIMVEIPRTEWPALPDVPNNGDPTPLQAEHLALLVKARLLPPAVSRETLPWTTPGGWAVTGEVRCNDGQLRRWVFRFHKESSRPLLNWDDPSGAAQRILSGSVIRQVGVLRQALTGIHIEPLIGFDAAYAPSQRGLEPAPSALRSLAREIRRYGGWSAQFDPLPSALNTGMADAGPDFIADNITSPAAEYALLTGDIAPLRALLIQSRSFDHRRFLRMLPGPEGISLHALAQEPFPSDALERLRRLELGPTENSVLYMTGPSLASAADKARPQKNGNGPLGPHLLLTALRAALPGPLFLSGSDLTGALDIQTSSPSHATLGGLALGSSGSIVTRKGFARAKTLYPPLQNQLKQENSYLSRLAALSALRARTKAAQGTLIGPLPADNASVLPVLTRLPDGNLLLAAANFSPDSVNTKIRLPGSFAGKTLDTANQKQIDFTGALLPLELGPWVCRILHLQPHAASRSDGEIQDEAPAKQRGGAS